MLIVSEDYRHKQLRELAKTVDSILGELGEMQRDTQEKSKEGSIILTQKFW